MATEYDNDIRVWLEELRRLETDLGGLEGEVDRTGVIRKWICIRLQWTRGRMNQQHLSVAIEAARAGATRVDVAPYRSCGSREGSRRILSPMRIWHRSRRFVECLMEAFDQYVFVGEEEGENDPPEAVRRGDRGCAPLLGRRSVGRYGQLRPSTAVVRGFDWSLRAGQDAAGSDL